jgi:tetratricopeptide (TPR) repeat protein
MGRLYQWCPQNRQECPWIRGAALVPDIFEMARVGHEVRRCGDRLQATEVAPAAGCSQRKICGDRLNKPAPSRCASMTPSPRPGARSRLVTFRIVNYDTWRSPVNDAVRTTEGRDGLILNRAITMSESDSRSAVRGDRKGMRRYVAWAAAIFLSLAILVVFMTWTRGRKDPQLLWNEAHDALRSGDFASAEAKLAMIGQLRAPTSFDWSLRAQIAVSQGRLDEALNALKRIGQDDPLAAEGFLLAGRIERQRNRIRASETYLRRAIACDPRLVGAHKELIYILGMQLRRREVDAEFKVLAQLTPLTHQELYTWGVTHFNFLSSSWAQDTAEHLESYIISDPDDRLSRLSLATLLVKSPSGEARLEQILAPLPRSDPEAAALLIESRFEHGRIDEAITMLEATSVEHPQIARMRGRVCLLRGDFKGTIRHLKNALTNEPYDRVAVSELGRALLLSGDKAAAESYLARAQSLDALYNLLNRVAKPDRENEASDLRQCGRACESAGLIDEARGWYQLAIGRDPLDAEAQQGLHRLRSARALGSD